MQPDQSQAGPRDAAHYLQFRDHVVEIELINNSNKIIGIFDNTTKAGALIILEDGQATVVRNGTIESMVAADAATAARYAGVIVRKSKP